MKDLKNLIPEIEVYVTRRLTAELPEGMVYHTIDHTRFVVAHSAAIGGHENLNENEMNILLISAWFHDIGYIKQYEGHEDVSIKIAHEFLTYQGIDPTEIIMITDCIRDTKLPQNPRSKIAAILCDADMMHLASASFLDLTNKLRKEWKKTGVRPLKRKAYYEMTLLSLQQHHFHTRYGQAAALSGKEKNMKALNQYLQSLESSGGVQVLSENKSRKEMTSFSRGVDSMLKLTARNQISLSAIADNKSNILISLNGILISMGLAFLVREFAAKPEIIMPSLIFLTFSLATIVLAILSTRPRYTSGKPDKPGSSKENLLFFGNFHNMKPNEYETAIRELIDNGDSLYTSMIRDQYDLGMILARKYKILRLTYSIFMIGIIATVVSFVLVYLPM